MELLCYGVFAGYEGDKGYYSTAWVPLEDVLMSITRETMLAKLSSFRDGLARAIASTPPCSCRLAQRLAQRLPLQSSPPHPPLSRPRHPLEHHTATRCFLTPPPSAERGGI